MSKKRRWIVLLLLIGILLWLNQYEKREIGIGWAEQLGKDLIWKLRQTCLEEQSVVMNLMTSVSPVFRERVVPASRDSELPFALGEEPISLGEEELKGLEAENLPLREGESVQEEESSSGFIPRTEKQQHFFWEEYDSLEKFLSEFYIVDPTTQAMEELFQPDLLLETDCSIEKGGENPQILLYHTHSQEEFADSIPGEKATSIVGAGDILAQLLEDYGYSVLHHEGEYDVESRDYAYSNSLPEIAKLLEENPSIQVVLDLHRDAVAEGTRLVTQLDGRPTAKVMFFNGLSRTKDQGTISYLENPYLKENLAFSLQMKVLCDEYYPGFARSIYLRAYRYNMHLMPKTLLIELGAQTNTVEEIHNALGPLAQMLDLVLSGKN